MLLHCCAALLRRAADRAALLLLLPPVCCGACSGRPHASFVWHVGARQQFFVVPRLLPDMAMALAGLRSPAHG